MKDKLIKSLSLINIFSLVALLILPTLYFAQKAQAAGLTQTVVRLDRLSATTATGGTVCVKPTTVDVETQVMVTFPAGFTVNGTAGNWTTTVTNLPFSATAWPGIGTATLVAGQNVTFPSTDLTVGTMYCFNFSGTTTLTNPAANNNLIGAVTTQKAGPTVIDSAQYALSIITNDQISITGTINPTFSVSLSQTATSFASIGNSVSNASPTPVITITTNARNGYTTWVKDANGGTLNSAGASSNIPTPGAVGSNYDMATKSGTGAFGLGVTASGGSATAAAEYLGSSFSGNGAGTLSTTYRPMASSTAVAAGDTITLTPKAIASVTQAPANDYTDTLTVVAAGQF